jgi:hypothetical protein
MQVLLVSILMVLIGDGAGQLWRRERTRERAGRICPGMTRRHVERILGKPTSRFAAGGGFLGHGHERWAYGCNRLLSVRAGVPPVEMLPDLRLFGPNPEDVAICFDPSGSVCEVERPADPGGTAPSR